MAGLFDLDPSLVNAVKGFEGFTPKAQWDYKQHTNGWGTRAAAPGEVIDRATADQRFQGELGHASGLVGAFAPNAPDGFKKALSSLTYNAGTKWMNAGLGQAVQAGDWNKARDLFLQYNKAGGETNPGLVNRRQQEDRLWLGGPQSTAPQAPQQPTQGADGSGIDPGWRASASPQPTQVADASGSIPPAPTAGPAVANDAGPQPLIPKQGTGMGGLLDGLDNAVASPLFQFGAGMAGAGSKGLGIGGGFAEGAETASRGYDNAKKKRELDAMSQRDAFIKSLSDPGNPIAAGFSPETVATLKGLPPDQSSALLAQLLSRKGDLAQAAAIAKMNADARVAEKNAEYTHQRQTDLDNAKSMMNMFGVDAGGQPQAAGAPSGPPQAPQVPGARKSSDGFYYIPDPNRPGKHLKVNP